MKTDQQVRDSTSLSGDFLPSSPEGQDFAFSPKLMALVLDPQGDTPRQRAEKAQDTELAAYLEKRQHYQMVQREDQETAV